MWPVNSPDRNVLNYHVWDAIYQRMRWNKVKNYRTLKQEIKRAGTIVPITDVASNVDSWCCCILQVLKNKGANIK